MIPIPTPEERKKFKNRYPGKFTLTQMVEQFPEMIPNIVQCIKNAKK